MNYFHTIYLDMDGVIANFHLEAIRAYMRVGKNLRHIGDLETLTAHKLFTQWPKGVSLQKYINPKHEDGNDYWSPEMDDFWKPIRIDPLFWRKIAPMGFMRDLIDLLKTYTKHLVICTTPDWDPNSSLGKRQWLIGQGLGDLEYVFIKHKWRLADPQALLIDDYERHVQSWCQECDRRFGVPGSAILFPAVWNENHHLWTRPVQYVEQMINGFLQTG